MLDAAEAFEGRHHGLVLQADAAMLAVRADVTSRLKAHCLDIVTEDVGRNRLFVLEKYDPFGPPFERKMIKPRFLRRKKWRVADSCWAPRAREGNSKDFLETEEGLSRMFRIDWEFAIRGHGLEKWIIKNDDEADTWRDADGNNIHDEVDEVFGVRHSSSHRYTAATRLLHRCYTAATPLLHGC